MGDHESELLFDRKQRFLQRGLECPRLLEALRRQPEGLGELLPFAVEELLDRRAENRSLQGLVEARNREIKFLHEVSLVLQASADRDEVIAMTLTAVTAGEGFGFNRAILMLVDREEQNLKGHFAVGPRGPAEADRIWRELEDRTLRETARHFFERQMPREKAKFHDLLEQLTVPLSHDLHPFVRTLNEKLSRRVPDLYREPGIDPAQARILGVDEIVLVPLVRNHQRIGLLLADNFVTRRPIAEEDMASLETFALPVSFAIERADLHQRLQEELSRVTEANLRLKAQQDHILRMEKMALIGEITSHVSHAIRNPLTIIGGFARSLLRDLPAEGTSRRHLESIIHESRRLEEALNEVLAFSESRHPTFDLWDVNQLVARVYSGLQENLKLSGAECRLALDPDLPHVALDFKKLSYCLRSILNNALEVVPEEGGRIVVRTSQGQDEVEIAVEDNGPGMAPETIRRVTTPYFSTKEQGSGLGLSLCARILKEHGGRLEIANAENRGTTVSIHLPFKGEDNHGATADRRR